MLRTGCALRTVRAIHAVRAARAVRAGCVAAAGVTLLGCAGQPDRFYALSTLPEAPPARASSYTTHVILAVSVPPVVDRRQMVIHTSSDQVVILEHDRWAAPLSELVSQTLARDIERRRPDVLVADRAFSSAAPVRARVDIVEMTARRGGQAIVEAHWRIVDTTAKSDDLGGEVFAAPLDGENYAAVAQAFSTDLAALADRLTQRLAAH
jgi:uncharacterized lipoprotein YmbA